jgi:hypothetical protein
MSACERCWSSAQSAGDPSAEYTRLLKMSDCTPEEQAGPDARECPVCHRKTLHQYTREPMCGCADEVSGD